MPFVNKDEIVTHKRDVWLLSKHRLICDSSLKENVFIQLIDGKRADLVLTDPSYNISAQYIGSSGKIKHNDFAMAAGEMSKEEFTQFLTTNMLLYSNHPSENALGYFWMNWRHIEGIIAAEKTTYQKFVNLCV